MCIRCLVSKRNWKYTMETGIWCCHGQRFPSIRRCSVDQGSLGISYNQSSSHNHQVPISHPPSSIYHSKYFDIAMISHRLKHSGPQRNSSGSSSKLIPGVSDIITFSLRAGTRHGIETRLFRLDTHRDLATWAKCLVQGAHNAAAATKEISCRE